VVANKLPRGKGSVLREAVLREGKEEEGKLNQFAASFRGLFSSFFLYPFSSTPLGFSLFGQQSTQEQGCI